MIFFNIGNDSCLNYRYKNIFQEGKNEKTDCIVAVYGDAGGDAAVDGGGGREF